MTAIAIIKLIIEAAAALTPLIAVATPLLIQQYKYLKAAHAAKTREERIAIGLEAVRYAEEYFARNPALKKSQDAAELEARKYIQRHLPKETVAAAEDLIKTVLPLAGLGAAAKKLRPAAPSAGDMKAMLGQ